MKAEDLAGNLDPSPPWIRFSVATSSPPAASAVLAGAGDIAECGNPGDEATADLLDGIGGTVFTTGDNVYPDGTAEQFDSCYQPSWGRHLARTRPAAGNHDYHTLGAAGYYDYFGSAAGDPAAGYYSYDLGAWHVVVLNSNCAQVACTAGSAQEQWLRQDLSASADVCTVAYWHHPLYSSGEHGGSPAVRPLYAALYDHGAELVLNGHDHLYERFAPQDPDGNLNSSFGIRQVTVGTGGRSLYAFGVTQPHSEARNNQDLGVVKVTLRDGSYDLEFVPVAGGTYSDTVSGSCHGPATAG